MCRRFLKTKSSPRKHVLGNLDIVANFKHFEIVSLKGLWLLESLLVRLDFGEMFDVIVYWKTLHSLVTVKSYNRQI